MNHLKAAGVSFLSADNSRQGNLNSLLWPRGECPPGCHLGAHPRSYVLERTACGAFISFLLGKGFPPWLFKNSFNKKSLAGFKGINCLSKEPFFAVFINLKEGEGHKAIKPNAQVSPHRPEGETPEHGDGERRLSGVTRSGTRHWRVSVWGDAPCRSRSRQAPRTTRKCQLRERFAGLTAAPAPRT